VSKNKKGENQSGLSRASFLKWAGAGVGVSAISGFRLPKNESFPEMANDLYFVPEGVQTRMTSSENPTGAKGQGAKTNKGAKGHPFNSIPVGKSLDLLNVKGAGVVNRIKLTTDNRFPEMLRSLRIDMYWDGASKPAVSSPMGDFFGVGLGQTATFQSALFSDPEGRSFNCFIPMPYKEAARIVITNQSKKDLHHIFYNVNFQELKEPIPNSLYFHCYWNRNLLTELGKDYRILPRVQGKGRFLGTNIGVQANPIYDDTWWGEGEVKTYLDGDKKYPTLAGTGTEDYIGTAWGMGRFVNRYQGATIADKKKKQWAFYRYHIPDPVYFHENIKVTVQQIGGAPRKKVRELVKKNAPLKLVTVDQNGRYFKLLTEKSPPNIMSDSFPKGWVDFYRRDDWSSAAYFYLDGPERQLPALPPVSKRVKDLRVS
jgi:hypothetical protein